MTEDRGALEAARRIAAKGDAEVTILHVVAPEENRGDAGLSHSWGEQSFPDGVHLKLIASDQPLDAAVHEAKQGYDVIVVGVSNAWGTTPSPFGSRHEALARASTASLLVVRRYARPADAGVASRDARDRDANLGTQPAGVV
jgi:nucleotide-binding universal stress UspA family protein